MKLQATFDLRDLTPEEMAQFEMRCRDEGTTPEKQFAVLIRQFLVSTGFVRRSAKKKAAALSR